MPENPFELDTTTPMTMYRFGSSSDLKDLFQEQLNRFPRERLGDGTDRLMFSEFGGIMIRPEGEPQEQLTHIIFPESILSIPGGSHSFNGYSDITLPQARLMADISTNSLFVNVMAGHSIDDELTEKRSVVFSTKEVFFNNDVWYYFSRRDQQRLAENGLGPDMTCEQWAIAIENHPLAFMEECEIKDSVIGCKILPMRINQRGVVGTPNLYFQMPGLPIYALMQNTFTEGDFYEIGSAHIHPKNEFSGLSEKVANRIGERKAQMTISPADVRVIRGSFDSNKIILTSHGYENKRTGESFISIVGVDHQGQVRDIQHHDFSYIENMAEMNALNDRTLETFGLTNPDIGLIAEHYEYFNSPEIASSELVGEIGVHVGDRSYIRATEH